MPPDGSLPPPLPAFRPQPLPPPPPRLAAARLGAASTEGSNPSREGDTHDEGDTQRGASAIRRDAWRLRSGHRGLVHDAHRSLACCGLGRKPIPGEDPDDAHATLAVDHDARRADIRGLLRCASPWACPVCAPKVAAARARVLAPQVSARLSAGWTAHLVTLTVRHGRHDALRTLLAGLGKAWSRLTSGRWWDSYRRQGAPEFVRGLDLTWSDRHGWHPHVHALVLLPPGHGEGGASARAVADRWREVLGRVGFQALPSAQDVQRCRDAEAAVAYATAPAAVYEAVGIGTKTGRDPRSGMTAFDLLRAAVPEKGEASPEAVARWVEYVTAVKGRKQTTVSRGLTLNEDAVLLDEEPEPELDAIVDLGGQTIAELDRTRRGPELLEAVEAAAGNPEAVRVVAWAVLGSLKAKDWSVIPIRAPVVQPAAVDPPPPAVWASPPEWGSPLTPEGRVWRRMTVQDRAILARLDRPQTPAPCSTGGSGGNPRDDLAGLGTLLVPTPPGQPPLGVEGKGCSQGTRLAASVSERSWGGASPSPEARGVARSCVETRGNPSPSEPTP